MIYNKKAFTLIELMVGITLIGILAFAVTQMDFNRLSNNQKLDIFAGKIKTSYETIRNNALAGKGIGTNLEIPKEWKINFSKTNSGTITIEAFNDLATIFTDNINIPQNFELSGLKCGEYGQDKSSYIEMNSTGTIIFNGINIKLDTNSDGNCNQDNDKVLEITVKNKVEKKVITINTLNGLVSITK